MNIKWQRITATLLGCGAIFVLLTAEKNQTDDRIVLPRASVIVKDNAAARAWVEHSLPEIMSYNYQNISQVRNNWNKYFSPAGLDSYNNAFDRAKLPEFVATNKITSTMTVICPAKVENLGSNGEKDRWQIKVIGNVRYADDKISRVDRLEYSLAVEKPEPATSEKPYAINQFIAIPNYTKDCSGKRTDLLTITEKSQDNPALKEWIEGSLLKIMTFDYKNIEEVREGWKRYLSPNELKRFNRAMDLALPDMKMIENRQSVRLEFTCSPRIESAAPAGTTTNTWSIKLRANIIFSGGPSPQTNPVEYIIAVSKNADSAAEEPYTINQLIVMPDKAGDCTKYNPL